MELIISSLADAIPIQKDLDITKVLSILDMDCLPYFDQTKGTEFTSIWVQDIEFLSDDPNAPSIKTVQQIFAFSKTLKEDDKVLIHCHAGISRSTAAALIVVYDKYACAQIEEVPKVELISKAGQFVHQIRPIAAPNRLICKYADEFFKHDGPYLYEEAQRLNILNNYKDFWNNKIESGQIKLN